jgi:uncharacterized repeat protein (TIGR01451 family)
VHWKVAIAAAACAGALAPTSGASAQTIGVPDLSGAPSSTMPCSSEICTVTGVEPGASHPFRAPANGRITGVRFRTQAEHESAGVRILSSMGLPNFLFGELFPLGPIPPAVPDDTHFFEVDIPVFETEILALELTAGDSGELIDLYTLFGATTATFDPAKAKGETGQPNPLEGYIPAVQFEFVPKIQNAFDPATPPPPPPGTADVAVTKKLEGLLPKIGGEAIFHVVVRNNGPETAHGVILRDTFGGGLAFDSAHVQRGSAGKPSCRGGTGRAAGVLICPLGALAPGAKVGLGLVFGVTGKASKGAGKGAKRKETNVATVSSGSPSDPNLKNNVARARASINDGGTGCPALSEAGTQGNDRLNGSGQSETILGLSGNDRLNGKRGLDCLFGGDDRDVLIGGPNRDYMDGGAGNDRILAVDGRPDTIVCGPGKRDRVVADRSDNVASDCERVRRR